MMGIREIREANADPKGYADSKLSDGQLRRQESVGHQWSAPEADREWTAPERNSVWNDIGSVIHAIDHAVHDAIKPMTVDVYDGYLPNPPKKFEEQTAPHSHNYTGWKRQSAANGDDAITVIPDHSLPMLYFDGMLLERVLAEAHRAAKDRHFNLVDDIRALKDAKNEIEMRVATGILSDTIAKLRAENAVLDIRLLHALLTDTVERIAPEPKGYVPTFGINHALAPVKKILTKMGLALSKLA